MALTRRTKKLSKTMALKISGRHILTCSECNLEEVEVPADVGRVTCCYCVQKMIAPPANYKSKEALESKKPRGWHLKQYYEQDGVVYSKGEVVTDVKEIAKLRKKSVKVSKTTTDQPKRGRGRPRKNPLP